MAATRFSDRIHAGKMLATQLGNYANNPDAIVLALPRGGVPVGFAVAEALDLPLDVMLVRKLGVPGFEELAMGAVASGGERVINSEAVRMFNISDDIIDAAARREMAEIERREKLYRSGRPPPQLQGRTVILVDDGLATGSTMLAAVQALRNEHPARVIVAVPVGASETCSQLSREVDDLICLATPDPFRAVGLWYENFAQTPDQEVIDLLAQSERERPAGNHFPPAGAKDNAGNQPNPR